MVVLNPATERRLKQLPQLPHVWEGDRRRIKDPHQGKDPDPSAEECILWVDGSEQVVRAMETVPRGIGPEAIVRTLLRAIEHPQTPGPAALPQKIIVRDREIQFFLRGVLQNLDIVVDYVPELPLIDEIFRGMEAVAERHQRPNLPESYTQALLEKAATIWKIAPWKSLEEHQIISLEINRWDIEKLYFSILGSGKMDYGVLMYRSLDSLKRFRQQIIHNEEESFTDLEQAFLIQDCLFLTFEMEENEEDDDFDDYGPDDVEPHFGNLHPLEGLRGILYEEEALVCLVALEAFYRFLKTNRSKLSRHRFPSLSNTYRIPNPQPDPSEKTVSVKVTTLPDVAQELWEMVEDDEDDDFDDEDDHSDNVLLSDDLIPNNSLSSLGLLPWTSVELLRETIPVYEGSKSKIPEKGEGLPIILIQTSQPKAKSLIKDLKEAGGLSGIGFTPGEDPVKEVNYDLGFLQTSDGKLHLFGEFHPDAPIHKEARKKWDQRCKNTKGWCGLVIAKGLTGASRGQPKITDMLALFEVRSVSGEELGIGILELTPIF